MTAAEARQRNLILALCCVGQFMVVLDVSIVNIALPSIRADLGFSAANLQWVINAYTVAFAGFLMLGGRACDLLGRREVFAAGLALFGVASLAAGMAGSTSTLVMSRAAQGLGAAVVAPASLAILATTFSEGADRNRAFGLWGAMGGAGGTVGAVLSGVLTQGLSWRWTLLINVPIAVVGVVAALRTIPAAEHATSGRRSFDFSGALTMTAGLAVLSYGIAGSEQFGLGSTRTLVTLAIGGGLLGVFALIEGRLAQAPLVPLGIFRSRTLSGANCVGLAIGASSFVIWYVLSLYLQGVLGFGPLKAGLAFVPMTVSLIVAARLAGRAALRFGPGAVLTGAATVLAVGLLWLSRVSADGSYLVDVLVPGAIVAAGMGAAYVSVSLAATTGVAYTESGLASGLVNSARQMGGSIGLAVLATVATQKTQDVARHVPRLVALTEGYRLALLLAGIVVAAGAVVSALVLTRVGRTAASAPVGPEAA